MNDLATVYRNTRYPKSAMRWYKAALRKAKKQDAYLASIIASGYARCCLDINENDKAAEVLRDCFRLCLCDDIKLAASGSLLDAARLLERRQRSTEAARLAVAGQQLRLSLSQGKEVIIRWEQELLRHLYEALGEEAFAQEENWAEVTALEEVLRYALSLDLSVGNTP
jgi:hypothetical protein